MPDWRPELRQRLASLRLPPAREADIADELAQHLDDRWRELTAGGMPPDEATRLTLAEFRDGNLLARYLAALRLAHQPQPIAAGASTGYLLGDLWQDVRYAVRTMAASPGFSAVAVLSLALGIGANTAIFSLWNGLLHASLPGVRDPGQLVILSNPAEAGSWTGRTDGVRHWLSYEEFEDLRDHAESFSAMMASQSSLNRWQARVDGGEWEDIRGRLVSGGFFEVLGAGAAMGRVFATADDRTTSYSAVISHAYWQRRFGGRPDVLGKTLTIRNAAFTIIGVTPRGFIGETSGQQPDFWLPIRVQPVVVPGRDRLHDTPPEKSMWLHVFGRLKPGVTAAQAEARANAIFQAGLKAFYGEALTRERREFLDQRLQVWPARRGASPTRDDFSQSLTTLLVAVGVLLLIACVNLANLLLARGTVRGPEMALRLSLGASRGRLMRQLLTESVVLTAMGAAAAIVVASVLHRGLVRMMAESDSNFSIAFALDGVVLAFVAGVALAATVWFGLLPAWQATRTDITTSLRHLTRGAIGGSGHLRSGRILASLQLALSLPLLVGAGLLARTAYNQQHKDLGFPAERLLLVRVDLTDEGQEPARVAGRQRELLDEIQRVPGVRTASFSELGVLTGGDSGATITVEGHVPKDGESRDSALDVVGPGYFETLGVRIALGREILASDQPAAPRICVINEAFAKQYFDGRNPIGLRITEVGDDDDRQSCQVVGVAGNARMHGFRGSVEPRYFVAAAQTTPATTSPVFLIRTTGAPGPVLAAVRKTIQRVDPALPIMTARSIEQQLAPLTAQDRTIARIAVVFGCVALALAAIGLYGVLSFGVARRTGEIAIRLALGAQAAGVVSMILRETVGVVVAGLALGGGLAYAASRLIASRLYGVGPRDPLTLILATGLLLLVALVAAYLPARRASKLDPIEALRGAL